MGMALFIWLVYTSCKRIACATQSVAYLVCMSEPCCTLLLAADKRNPVTAAATEAFPDVWVAVHASDIERLFEGAASGGADAVGERLVVPVGRVLQDQPSSRLAMPHQPSRLFPWPRTHLGV